MRGGKKPRFFKFSEFQRQEIGKDGKMLTKAALTMPRDINSSPHLNQGFRLGFMQVRLIWGLTPRKEELTLILI